MFRHLSLSLAALCALPALAQVYSVSTVAGGALPNMSLCGSGDDGSAANAGLAAPVADVAADSSGVYIAAAASVRKVSPNGTITTIAGCGQRMGESVPAREAALAPVALALDSRGTLHIAYTAFGIYRVRRLQPDGTIITVAGGAGCCETGDGGAATDAYLGIPYGIAISGSTLYIAQSDGFGRSAIRRVGPDGTIHTVAGSGLVLPAGIVADSSGNLIVADAGANRVVSLSPGGTMRTLAALPRPWHVALDRTGGILVAQRDASRVSRIGPDGTIAVVADALDRPSGLAVDPKGQILVADADFQMGRVVMLTSTSAPPPPPVITPGGIVPVSGSAATIQPGSWASIYGTNLAAATAVWTGDFPTTLGGTSVTVNGKPAYLWFVSPTQINFQAPADTAEGPVPVTVRTAAGSATQTVVLARYSPAFLLLNARYPVAIVAVAGAGNSGWGYDVVGPTAVFGAAARPARPGETLVLYGVGFGPTIPNVAPGQPFIGAAQCVVTPQVTIGGVPATVSFAGLVGAGLFQLNVVVPDLPSGDHRIEATVGNVRTQPGLFLTLR